MLNNRILAACCAAAALGALPLAQAASDNMDSQDFVTKAAQSNLAEIKASQLALDKTQNPQVRELATRMIKDHEAANAQLEPLAKAKNLKIPDDTDMMHKASMKLLQAKSGSGFDSTFLKQMDKDHTKTIELFQKASSSSKVDPELQALATKLLPTLQHHEQLVASLETADRATREASKSDSGSSRNR